MMALGANRRPRPVTKSALIVLLMAVFAAACGAPNSSRATPSLRAASDSRSSSPSPSASTSALTASVLLVVRAPVPTPGSTVTLQLFHEDGTSAGQLTPAAGSDVVAVAGRRIF